jgi:hypothetical protein
VVVAAAAANASMNGLYTQNVNSRRPHAAKSRGLGAEKVGSLAVAVFVFTYRSPICYSPRLKSLRAEKWPCRAVFAGYFSDLLVKYRGQLIKPRGEH